MDICKSLIWTQYSHGTKYFSSPEIASNKEWMNEWIFYWLINLQMIVYKKILIFFPVRIFLSISRGVAFGTPLPFPWWTGQSTTNYWDEWFLLSEKTIILFRYTLSIFIVGVILFILLYTQRKEKKQKRKKMYSVSWLVDMF